MKSWEIYTSITHRDLPPFADITEGEWSDWRWQKGKAITIYHGDINAIKKLEFLAEQWLPALNLDVAALSELTELWAININPYLALQLNRLVLTGHTEWAKQMIHWLLPTEQKTQANLVPITFRREGMGTAIRADEAYPNMPYDCTRLYDNRIIVRLSTICPVACQYCFRQHDVAEHHDLEGQVQRSIGEAFKYVESWNRENPSRAISDVIFSGGDPLTLSDNKLFEIMANFKSIDGVELLRLDTKYPAILPQRITKEFANGLEQFQPLIITIHFTHPGELSPEVAMACNRLADSGSLLGSHTPLLKGVNNNREDLKELFQNLILMRVRPYYLVQSVDTPGTDHFRVPVEQGLELIKHLESEISGVAHPHFIIYTPGGGGKVHLEPQYLKERVDEGWIIDTWRGPNFYPDPKE